MDTKEFLEQVVPWNLGGYVTIHWHLPGQPFRGRSCRTLDDALSVVANLMATTHHNIYFCISCQNQNDGQRDREHAMGLVCIPMDLDIKKGNPKHYQSLPEAIAELFKFCIHAGIPRPSIMVATGGGLHVYWLSNRVLPVEEWQPYADALKAAAKKAGLKFDAQCTGDAARVLRVPDTKNWKYEKPRSVRLLPDNYCPNTKLDFAVSFQKIKEGYVHAKVEVASAFKHLPVTPLSDGVIKDIPPLPFEPIMEECGFLREAFATGGKAFDNNLWNLTTLISTFLENGHELAHKFGDQHATYDFEKTEEIWERKNRERQEKNIGWPKCETIENAGCSHCATCQHRGKEKSPVNIGFQAYANPVDKDLKLLGGTRPDDMRLPPGYCLNERGQVCAVLRARKVKTGLQPARLVMLFLTIIKSPSLQFKDGKFGLGFINNTDKFGTGEVFLHSGNCSSNGGLFKHLGNHCVLHNTDKGAPEMAEKFMMSWLDKLLTEDEAIRDSGTMGWRYDGNTRIGFVYGNMLYHVDGKDVPLVASTESEFRSHYMPVGDREAWIKACKLLTDRKRPELDIIIAVGFAAPLMTFAGTLYGAIISIWGHPGTSKSTAQMVAAAVWGHPKQTRESLNSSPKSIQKRLGLCRNLAAYWDDVQSEKHQDSLFDCMFVATQGAEGGRLNQDSSMKERLDWQTLLVVCSNASFVEYLINKQKSTTAGIRRVFEIEFIKHTREEPGMIDPSDAGKVFAALERNYGQIGVEYARMLAKEHVDIEALVLSITKRFRLSVAGTGDEAYWWGSCGAILAGATLANRLGAELDIDAMTEYLKTMFLHNRLIRSNEGTEGGSYQNTELGLVGFMNFCANGNTVWTDRLFTLANKKVKVSRGPAIGRQLTVQIVKDVRKIIFSKRGLKKYLRENEIQIRQVLQGLEVYFKAKEVRHTLGAGTEFAGGQEHCLEIYIPEGEQHILADMLEAQS